MPNQTLESKPKETMFTVDIMVTKKVIAVVDIMAPDAEIAKQRVQPLVSFKVSKTVPKRK